MYNQPTNDAMMTRNTFILPAQIEGDFSAEELSEDIKTTAKLRIANPDMSLTELAAIHNPPISKSGLNHRLTKITELAKKRKLI